MTITALPSIPLIQQGDDLVRIILDGLTAAGLTLHGGDALVVTSKIVSKAEGRLIDLKTIEPSAEAEQLAGETQKDARVVELILRESQMISRKAPGVIVTQHRLGFVSANSGIDQSNVAGDEDHVLLLPENPDESAQKIHEGLLNLTGVKAGVIISDSHGRPFRMGNVGVAIGVAGMPALIDLRGQDDLFGRKLKISIQSYADMVASAAALLSGEGNEGRPIMLVRGLNFPTIEGHASDLNRPPEQDLYR